MTLLIVGLDGATFDILDPLAAQGLVPHLARLMSGGVRAELLSTLPPATLPAWTSFLCGTDPSRHGITDIFMTARDSYDLVPAQGTWRLEPTFLNNLDAAGLRVAGLGVPGTYPPERLARGLCVSGFDAPGASEAGPESVWPPSLHAELRRLGGWRYATFNEHARGTKRLGRAVRALLRDIDAKERVIRALFARQPWDCFFVHLQASDTIAHHLWHAHDPRSPRHSPALAPYRHAVTQVYARLDRLIGALISHAGPQARVMVVSDHGMGGASRTAVHLNRFLAERGWLTFADGARRASQSAIARGLRPLLERLPPWAIAQALAHTPPALTARLSRALRRAAPIQWRDTVAFSHELDYAPAVWLHRRGVFPHGCLGDTEAQRLGHEIRAALLELRDPGGVRLVREVYMRDAIATGPARERFPDLLIEPEWPGGYRPSFLPSDGPGPTVSLLPTSAFHAPKGAGVAGVHRREGVFVLAGPGVRPRRAQPLHIAEAGALVYRWLGVEAPPSVTARVPADLATHLGLPEQSSSSDRGSGAPPPAVSSSDGSAGFEQRLRALGYLN